MRTFLLCWTAAALAFAAEPSARLSSPVLGYIFDSDSKAVRPIAGVPGAASLEAVLPSASKLEIGFVSPNREWLLAILLEGGAALVDLRSGSALDLPEAPRDIALGAWSADGATVALWSRSGTLQVWSGLPGAPALRFSQSMENAAGIAVADSGRSALLWSDSGLFSVDADGVRQLAAEPVTGAAFRPGSADWAAVTGTQLLGSTVEPRALQVEKPTGVAYIKDGLLVAGSRAVEKISEAGGSTIIPCNCEATTLDRLAGSDVFRLTGLQAEWIAIFDGSAPEPAILYIPSQGGRQ